MVVDGCMGVYHILYILEFEIDSCNFVLYLLLHEQNSRVVMTLTEPSQSKNIYILPKTRREGEGM